MFTNRERMQAVDSNKLKVQKKNGTVRLYYCLVSGENKSLDVTIMGSINTLSQNKQQICFDVFVTSGREDT